MESKPTMEDIVSLAKRRGFIYQGSEIYGGLAGTYDYGPLGTLLKRNIVAEWLKFFVDGWGDMYQIDSAILMNPKVWQASGHVDTFTDPLVECSNCHSRQRADKIKGDKCPACGKAGTFGQARQFNLMFKTNAGPLEDENSAVYLRPETAQGMFTNYKNILDSFYPDLPFGIAQVGKAFRNEISPRDFLFRTREFEIMEFEFFIKESDWEPKFEKWRKDMHSWFKHLGLDVEKIKELEVPAEDRAHYSKRTIDFLYDFPSLGFDEVGGLAYRTDFDLKKHQEHSGKDMSYRPKDGSEPFIPHVIEPTFGVDRNFLAVLCQAYSQDEQGGEKRVFLKLPSHLAPVKVAVFPLLKNKPELVEKAREVYKTLRKQVQGEVMWDDNGNIGKRYRRQDEIGTPYCVTIDFQSLEDDTVTVRHRDTTEQTRQKNSELSL
ncbi:MAG TPA: glycine--tRNA ligase [Candidatus Saccharimonadales bacterium]|nr:glycine--tRNA ligase [Candidatus Saccharimonadales bacterium]